MIKFLWLLQLVAKVFCSDFNPSEARKVNIGIDLGTTFSCVCIYDIEDKTYSYVTFNQDGSEIIPSTVYVKSIENGQLNTVVGYEANMQNKNKNESDGYFYGFKRLMGVEYNMTGSEAEHLENFKKYATYSVLRDENTKGVKFPVRINGQTTTGIFTTPFELSIRLLVHFKNKIAGMGYTVKNTCIATPAYFSNTQNDLTRDAAVAAGFPNVIVTKEPVAACVSYASNPENGMKLDNEERILVFDFGGGTLDISIVEVENVDEGEKGVKNIHSHINVLNFVGDNFLGGENINDCLVDNFKAQIADQMAFSEYFKTSASFDKLRSIMGISAEFNNDVEKSRAINDFFRIVNNAKGEELKKYSEFLGYKTRFKTNKEKHDYVMKMFGNSTILRLRVFSEQFKIALCNKISDAKKNRQVGVVSHSEKFLFGNNLEITFSMTEDEFNKITNPVYERIIKLFNDPLTGIFRAKQGQEVVSGTMDSNSIQKVILVGGSTRVPMVSDVIQKICKNAKLYFNMDVDKCVARGACEICTNADDDSGMSTITLISVVPLSVGIKVASGQFVPLLKKGQALPCSSSQMFTTYVDGQTAVDIEIATGERTRFVDNIYVGNLRMDLSTPLAKNVPQIEISLEMTENYELIINAHERTGKSSISHTFSSSTTKPSEAQVKAMVEAAEKNKESDAQYAKVSELFNTYRTTLDFYKKQLDTPALVGDAKDQFEAIYSGHKEWLDANINDSNILPDVIDGKVKMLQKDLEEINKAVIEANAANKSDQPQPQPDSQNVPGSPEPETTQAKEEGREGL